MDGEKKSYRYFLSLSFKSLFKPTSISMQLLCDIFMYAHVCIDEQFAIYFLYLCIYFNIFLPTHLNVDTGEVYSQAERVLPGENGQTTSSSLLSTLTYQRNKPVSLAHMFLVDENMTSQEMDCVLGAVITALRTLPSSCLVGLATFGSVINLYELGRMSSFSSFPS